MKKWIAAMLGLMPVTNEQYMDACDDAFERGEKSGFNRGLDVGKTMAKVIFRPMPLPFTSAQLAGGQYGEFITPAGFGSQFGECMIPAPSTHGYEQRAYYVGKDTLDDAGSTRLVCLAPAVFDLDKIDSESRLVPVIVTVLR